jgi:hypothetical protein
MESDELPNLRAGAASVTDERTTSYWLVRLVPLIAVLVAGVGIALYTQSETARGIVREVGESDS